MIPGYVRLITAAVLFFWGGTTFAFEVRTHRQINSFVVGADVNQFSLNRYLRNQIGFVKGIDEPLSAGNVRQWIEAGGEFEDDFVRFLRHFHQPLRTWDQAGLKSTIPLVFFSSSILWAQAPVGQQSWYGDYSWHDTRSYFYQALTLPAEADRSRYFGETFRGVGQLMHLAEDLAVPAHTRDDAHPFAYSFETWASWQEATFDRFLNLPPIGFDPSILTFPPNPLAPVPIAKFFDTDQYDGTNPSITTSPAMGLAEYTHANFFSEDTINDVTYPYPRLDPLQLTTRTFTRDTGGTYQRRFYLKTGDGETNGGQGYLLAAESWLDYYQEPGLTFNPIPMLDDHVYEEYANLLVPRAVGYAAGMMQYFFRGSLDVHRVPSGLVVTNAASEVLAAYTDSTGATIGSLDVYFDNATTGMRELLASYPLTTPLAPGETTSLISFTSPSNNVTPGRYIVVFRGKLGAEEGAVVGKVISEVLYYVATRADGLEQILRWNADGTTPTVVYDNLVTRLNLGRVTVSPDGRTLAVGSGLSPQTSAIYLVDLMADPSTPATRLTTGDAPAWSPDGRLIAFERESGLYLPALADIELYTINVTTGIETPLTNVAGSSVSQHPAWSPDGSRIAYSRSNSNPQEPNCANFSVITVIEATGVPVGPVTCDTVTAYSDIYPAWSPDGGAVAFVRRHPNPSTPYRQLHRVDLAGGALTKLTDNPGASYDELAPAWAPDGTRIAVGSGRDGDADIWLVDPAGTGTGYLTNLTNANPGIDEFPAYGP